MVSLLPLVEHWLRVYVDFLLTFFSFFGYFYLNSQSADTACWMNCSTSLRLFSSLSEMGKSPWNIVYAAKMHAELSGISILLLTLAICICKFTWTRNYERELAHVGLQIIGKVAFISKSSQMLKYHWCDLKKKIIMRYCHIIIYIISFIYSGIVSLLQIMILSNVNQPIGLSNLLYLKSK